MDAVWTSWTTYGSLLAMRIMVAVWVRTLTSPACRTARSMVLCIESRVALTMAGVKKVYSNLLHSGRGLQEMKKSWREGSNVCFALHNLRRIYRLQMPLPRQLIEESWCNVRSYFIGSSGTQTFGPKIAMASTTS